MKIVTSQQMRALDKAAIEIHGIPSLELMERAATGLADASARLIPSGRIAVFAGRGNNGGDGLAAARILSARGYEVSVVLLARPDELSPDAKANYERLKDARMIIAADEAGLSLAAAEAEKAACMIDAIFGTGLDRDVAGIPALAIEIMNSSKAPIVAADIPSGLSSDTGRMMGNAVRAARTVTFGLPKLGLFIADGPAHAGRVEICDIGIPKTEIAGVESKIEMIEPAMIPDRLAERQRAAHKGDYGRVAVFAGSDKHLGAGYLSCMAALRAGCGLITYCLPQSAFSIYDARYPEIMCDAIPDSGLSHFSSAGLDAALHIAQNMDVIAIGPAVGTSDETDRFVNEFLRKVEKPVVVDADALNVLDMESVSSRSEPTVLTPHPGEMARLFASTTAKIQGDRLGAAVSLAQQSGAVVVLKGAATIVASPDGRAAINPTGNPGMASAGMGDALTGIIASFMAQGLDAREAAVSAVYLHGLAGDLAAEELGEASMIASDVIERLGRAMKTSRASCRTSD